MVTAIGQDSRIENSIVWNPGPGTPLFRTNQTIYLNCSMVSHKQGFENGVNPGGDVPTGTPHFVDEEGGDYRLLPESLAVDRCSAPANPSTPDVDGEARGFDAGGLSSPDRIYDMGADEFVP